MYANIHVIFRLVTVLTLISVTLVHGQEIEEVILEPEIFISWEYIFENESINRPYAVKWHDKTKELFVSDFGNNCIYVFSDKGLFKRIIGHPGGQGPGDLHEPLHIDIGSNDLLYVYENGNSRISIFDLDGKFINFIRTGGLGEGVFDLNNNNEIIINRPNNGYLLTVYSTNGNIINQLGIADNSSSYQHSKNFGIPFSLENGNYGIVLQAYGLIKIFSSEGNILNEVKFQEIFSDEMPYLDDAYKKAQDLKSIVSMFYDIRYFNNKLFMLRSGITDDSKTDFNIGIIYEVDEKFNLTKKISFKFPFNIEPPRGRIRYNTIIYSTFDVAENGNIIFFPLQDFASVCIFKLK